jgi:hypothetical protein
MVIMISQQLFHINNHDLIPWILLVHATSTEEEKSSELDSYNDKTSQEAQSAGQLFKIWPV